MVRDIWPDSSAELKKLFPGFAAKYAQIKDSAMPNFMGAQLPVDSGLNIPQWNEALIAYHDSELCSLLEFGWPVGFLNERPPVSVPTNHKMALENPAHVEKFIRTELDFKAMLGPFQSLPFEQWTCLSPLMTRPKKDSLDGRVIVDLSFPAGGDVNSAIDIDQFFGRSIRFSLPSISDLITRLQSLGPGAYIWKADLSRAYRQLRLDPVDVPLMAIQFKGEFFLDLCPPFGCRSSSAACQRTSAAVVYLMSQAGFNTLAYLDDFAGAEFLQQEADQAFQHFKALSSSLGLQLAEKKCFPPAQKLEWLGYQIDTNEMTVAIPQEKLQSVIQECQKWLTRERAIKTMIQSLIGKLLHVFNCIRQGKKFTARILDTLRAMGDKSWTTISYEFMKDVQWFLSYALEANGVSVYSLVQPSAVIECDSSLLAGGAVGKGFYYQWIYSQAHKEQFPAIHHLEATNIVTAYKTFAPLIEQNAAVIIQTNNITSAFALMSGETRDKVLAACSRELWLQAAFKGHDVTITHKPGETLLLADALSRASFNRAKAVFAQEIIAVNTLSVISPSLHNDQFFSTFL